MVSTQDLGYHWLAIRNNPWARKYILRRLPYLGHSNRTVLLVYRLPMVGCQTFPDPAVQGSSTGGSPGGKRHERVIRKQRRARNLSGGMSSDPCDGRKTKVGEARSSVLVDQDVRLCIQLYE